MRRANVNHSLSDNRHVRSTRRGEGDDNGDVENSLKEKKHPEGVTQDRLRSPKQRQCVQVDGDSAKHGREDAEHLTDIRPFEKLKSMGDGEVYCLVISGQWASLCSINRQTTHQSGDPVPNGRRLECILSMQQHRPRRLLET